MGEKKSAAKQRELFQRELELLNTMVSNDEDPEKIADQLSNLCLKEKEASLVMYGPLSEAFYFVNCPFVWSEYVSGENMESLITTVMEECGDHISGWKTFCFYVYSAFLYGRLGKMSDASKMLTACEEFLNENAEDDFYKEIMDGLNHIIQASWAHLNFLKGDVELADDIISSVIPLKELDNPSKAALIGLNAEVMQAFDSSFREMALNMMWTAVKLDPDDKGSRRGMWYYTVGKLLGQLRRMEHRAGIPSQEELQMLERAKKINPLAVTLAALADSYREATYSAKFSDSVKISDDICTKMLTEARQLYKQAYEHEEQSYATLRRCGNGLMKLPPPYKDLPLAKQCLEKAIKLNPKGSSAYQALGTMEEKYCRNFSAALKYFQLSYDNGNPISASFIIQVRKKMDRNYNPIEDLDTYIKDMEGVRDDMKAEFLTLKGEYLFFLQHDLIAAAKVWKEAILLAPESENVMNHVCRFLDGRFIKKPYVKKMGRACAFNLYDCLKYEIRNSVGSPRYTSEEEKLLKELLKLCMDN